MKKAIVLLSGGLDSTTCLAIAKNLGYECYTLSFDYGQKHRSELNAAKNISKLLGAKRHEIVSLSIGSLGGSSLTDQSIPVPVHSSSNGIPSTYVPARNTVFLSIALGWAEILNAQAIFIGVTAVDYSGYPDCRPEYIAAFQGLANLATKMGISGKKITIETPLINFSKSEIICCGNKLDIDYSMTVSCYSASDDGSACGKCDSCFLRKKGFKDASLVDQTRYQIEVTGS